MSTTRQLDFHDRIRNELDRLELIDKLLHLSSDPDDEPDYEKELKLDGGQVFALAAFIRETRDRINGVLEDMHNARIDHRAAWATLLSDKQRWILEAYETRLDDRGRYDMDIELSEQTVDDPDLPYDDQVRRELDEYVRASKEAHEARKAEAR